MNPEHFEYVPDLRQYQTNEESRRIRSGYYIKVDKHLEILKKSLNEKKYDPNPFAFMDEDTVAYLDYLKQKQRPRSPVYPVANVNVNNDINELEKVIENMSPEDINAIENILNGSLNPIVDVDNNNPEPEPEIDLKCFEEMPPEDKVIVESIPCPYHGYNYMEMEIAEALIDLHRN